MIKINIINNASQQPHGNLIEIMDGVGYFSAHSIRFTSNHYYLLRAADIIISAITLHYKFKTENERRILISRNL